jgi:hypothetical protein
MCCIVYFVSGVIFAVAPRRSGLDYSYIYQIVYINLYLYIIIFNGVKIIMYYERDRRYKNLFN